MHTINGVSTAIGAFVGSFPRGAPNRPVECRSLADFERGFGGETDAGAASAAIRQFFENGGATARVVRVAGDAGRGRGLVSAAALVGDRAARSGIYALDSVDLVNVVCLPDAADLASADETRAVYRAAIDYAAGRRALVLVDVPEAIASPEAMQAWMAQNESLRSRNAAVYFPRPLVPAPSGGRLRGVAASGAIAGLFARLDGARGVWQAPAGAAATLLGVKDLACRVTDPQIGALNALGVNCLRVFPAQGPVCWGARTLDGADRLASQWKYLSVVRLALYIEESVYRGTRWAVFEPNAEPLWSEIRLGVGAFLDGLFRQGAFQGTKAQDAWFVKCDRTTTTQADIDAGIVIIEIGFAPLKPAEFVVLRIRQSAGRPR